MPQSNEYMLKQDDAELIYQKKLTAGTNITIDPVTNTISSTGGGGSSVSYRESLPQGYGDTIGIITIDGTQYPIKTRNLIQGSNINIVQDQETGNLTISSTAQGTRVEPNPSGTPTDTLDTVGINGIIYEIEGGGSGNVTDVYVNGTSVLDANDIAQVFSHEEITEINYDNLPSTKFSDNHMYLIKEAGTPPTGEYYNPVIYSEEEREVGVWKDNKPLYQKTIPITKTGTATLVDISSLNIDTLAYCTGVEYPADKSFFLTLNYHENTNWYCFIEKVGDDLGVYCSNQDYQGAPYVLATIQYTKTTDVAGSGSYTTLGVPAVHYTTDEQVIGTWIDGKPLYQKTYSITEITVRPTVTLVPSFDISSMDRIINAVGTHTQYQQSAPLLAFIDSNQFYLSTSLACMIDTITLQYTKTTD